MRLAWDQIDTTLLDMDGTLLDLHFDNFFWLEHLPQRYAQIHDRVEDIAREDLFRRYRETQGSLNWYCLDYWSRELDLDIRSLKREVSHLIKVRPFVEEFLLLLRGCKKRVILVTNAHFDSLELKLEQTGLQRWLDRIVCAHSLKRPKEDPAFWSELRGIEAYDPERTLLIDDNSAVLESAGRFGIRYLITLLMPDSRQTPRDGLEHPAILHFDEMIPDLQELVSGREY